eukprot:CAMPEP_0119329678 /NCGR_PEP_ID=MMETSP1333-20130426/76454_1 /TAXON_ID=418940 /ORGANISM="Scyphosphaera apsteinii, Strain RCC1455" /LENGTH=395 /DNA_ID=CAMNT_0007338855 /DNA_START=107 /DNA_END=1294 /DNA_ORIENTATION=+
MPDTVGRRTVAPCAVTTMKQEREQVVQVSRTEETVHALNSIRLDRHRCHSISTDAPPDVDPFALVKDLLDPLSMVVREQLTAESGTLGNAAQHFFGSGKAREGKRVRPVIVLLMGQGTALLSSTGSDEQAYPAGDTFAKQVQLASITEMIHTASLIHDDVLDAADTRRGDSAVHKLYSSRAAVLSGDFLLARASVALARLENTQVVREMAKSLEALVQGEIMQLKSTAEERLSMEYYLSKSYCKTASLMAYSCKSAALLSGHAVGSEVTLAAEKYGYHFGLAFQVIDDLLDFTGTSETLGKPGLQDMSLGLSTAPVLYAAEEHPELQALIARKFSDSGDVSTACDIVMRSQGLQKTKELATFHAQAAVDACCSLPASEARDGLIRLCHVVLSRSS